MTEPQTPGRGSPPAILRLALDRPPTLGKGRLVCVDGPAGSGKTTLAAALAELGGGGVVHMDDLYEGWSGLATIDQQLHELLTPLSEGRAGRYRRYDWDEKRFAEEVVVEPAAMTILEGVASGAARFADLITVLVWIEAPHDVRLRRGLERDGDAFAPHWERWAADEVALFARERTRQRADVVVDGTRPLR
ncbi:MAG: 4-amino-4-deoxy-L-arabinose transferase [Marmoricola sp.]